MGATGVGGDGRREEHVPGASLGWRRQFSRDACVGRYGRLCQRASAVTATSNGNDGQVRRSVQRATVAGI